MASLSGSADAIVQTRAQHFGSAWVGGILVVSNQHINAPARSALFILFVHRFKLFGIDTVGICAVFLVRD